MNGEFETKYRVQFEQLCNVMYVLGISITYYIAGEFLAQNTTYLLYLEERHQS